MIRKEIFKYLVSILIVLILLSSCSNQSLTLISSNVKLSNDEDRLGEIEITSGPKKNETITPLALSYDLQLKNMSKETLGNTKNLNERTYEYGDGIQIHIKPSKTLKGASEELLGYNLYDETEEKHLGIGKTSIPVLESKQEGTYSFDFILGALEENPNLKLAPSPDQLETLLQHAVDATLIVTIEGEEIAHFDLNPLD